MDFLSFILRIRAFPHAFGERAWSRFSCTILCVASLAGCSFTDSVDSRYETINRSTDAARNQAILINIIRASHAEPLNFVAFSKVSGTTSTGLGVGLPSFVVGPDRLQNQKQFTFGNSTLNSTVSANSSFDIAVLDTKDFYGALLAPVDDLTLNFFQRQGYPRELLFWLFADSIRVTENGRTVEYRNEPSEMKSCEPPRNLCFVNFVDAAVDAGFSVETRTVETPVTGTDGKTKLVTKTEARPCFDTVLQDRARRERDSHVRTRPRLLTIAEVRPICGRDPWPEKQTASSTKKRGGSASTEKTEGLKLKLYSTAPQTPLQSNRAPAIRALTPGGAQQTIEIPTRSTYGIYQYLGRILAENAMYKVRLDDAGKEDAQILTITDDDPSGCFAEADYLGKHYCVPVQGAENTKRVIGLLAQLLALKTPQTDLPFTPTVRVTP